MHGSLCYAQSCQILRGMVIIMKKDKNITQKILLVVIGVLAVILMAVLINKAYQLHQEKLLAEEWEVRHQEIQSELEDVQIQIQELAGDGDALQEFLDEKLNPAIVVEEPVPVEKEDIVASETEENTVNEEEAVEAASNAIIINEPEPVPNVPVTDDSVKDASESEIDETISENRAAKRAEEEARAAKEAETVSQNRAAAAAKKAEEEARAAAEAETVSQNRAAEAAKKAEEEARAAAEAETVSQNQTPAEDKTISGNAIVNGQVIPFRYQETEVTLLDRREIRSSYEETAMVNAMDREIIDNNTYDFSGMKIACIGDSLTSGSNMDGVEDNYEQYSYPVVLKNLLQAAEVYNLGIGGSSYGRYWDQAFVDRYTQIPADSDIILVMGGTNDGFAASAKELGSFEEKKSRTFYGDVDELMRGLKENYPNAKIIFATPLPNVLHDYLRKQRDYLLPQSVFADAINELAAQYNIDVIDLYNSNILDTHDAQVISTYMPDGVHGNIGGYQVLAEHFASEIIQIMERDALYAASASVSGNMMQADEGNNNPESVQSDNINISEGGETAQASINE